MQHSSFLWMPPILQIFFASKDMLVLLFSSLAAITPFCPFWWRNTLELQVTKLFVPQLVFHNTKEKHILNVRGDVFMSMLRYMSVSKENKSFSPKTSALYLPLDISHLGKKVLLWHRPKSVSCARQILNNKLIIEREGYEIVVPVKAFFPPNECFSFNTH